MTRVQKIDSIARLVAIGVKRVGSYEWKRAMERAMEWPLGTL